jgi:hypothetical protein
VLYITVVTSQQCCFLSHQRSQRMQLLLEHWTVCASFSFLL